MIFLKCENADNMTYSRAGVTARFTWVEEGLSTLPGGREAFGDANQRLPL